MFSHAPPHLPHQHQHHPLQHQSLHRPPTAPATPDTEHSTHTWAPTPSFPQHMNQQLQPATNIPPYLFDRRQFPYSAPAADATRQNAAHTPQIAATQSTTPGASASGPLLPQNLAQHLNNPPPPTGSQQSINPAMQTQAGPGTASVTGASAGGKVLLMPNGAPPPAGSDEEKIYILITELLEPETREAALLELSKKRELYEDLALVLWGGFGASLLQWMQGRLTRYRYHELPAARDRRRLSSSFSAILDCPCFQPGMQCARSPSVCREPFRHTSIVLKW